MSPAVELIDLTKRFDGVDAVRGLNLQVNPGELFGIVGPDGAGKTTTIRMLCGIIAPSSGTARVFGLDTRRDRLELVRNIGYLSQRFTLYGDLSVDENIQFFAEIHGVRDFVKRRDELLEFTRLTPARERLAEQLSGGMKQKLALACTLIHSPRLIILDEPTTGVDPVSRRDFWVILSQILQKGITIVMATPYLEEAERCTRVAMMNEGELLEVDTPRAIKGKMHDAVIEIICSPVREANRIIRDRFKDLEVQLFGDRLHIISSTGERVMDAVGKSLRDSGITITAIHTVAPHLENVFISLIRRTRESAA